MTVLELHELSEARHRILDPFSDAKLALIGDICAVQEESRVLDLACGKGEMLCQWAQAYGSAGHGVDISEVFLAAAAARAVALGVADRVTFERHDASTYAAEPAAYDVVSCLGAAWIGNGLVGTIDLMRPAVRAAGHLIIGEPYWIDPPPPEAVADLGYDCTSLGGTLDRLESAGVDLVEMVAASTDDWDRYVASQWATLTSWLQVNADDPRAHQVREFRDVSRRTYLEFQRRHLGWAVFIVRP